MNYGISQLALIIAGLYRYCGIHLNDVEEFVPKHLCRKGTLPPVPPPCGNNGVVAVSPS